MINIVGKVYYQLYYYDKPIIKQREEKSSNFESRVSSQSIIVQQQTKCIKPCKYCKINWLLVKWFMNLSESVQI